MATKDNALENIRKELNSTGIFLESYVSEYFRSVGFGLRREVGYHINNGVGEPIDGEVDIVASRRLRDGSLVCFIVECKRALPEQKFWVFERGHVGPSPFPLMTYKIPESSPIFRHDIHLSDLGYSAPEHYENSFNVYEFDLKSGKRINNIDKRERAFLAIKQVNEAYSGIAIGAHKALEIAFNAQPSEGTHVLYMPVVVTTANLLIADYNPRDVDIKTGSILDPSKINLDSKAHIHFEYSLPGLLQAQNGGYEKRATFIVNVESLHNFIENVSNSAETYMNI